MSNADKPDIALKYGYLHRGEYYLTFTCFGMDALMSRDRAYVERLRAELAQTLADIDTLLGPNPPGMNDHWIKHPNLLTPP